MFAVFPAGSTFASDEDQQKASQECCFENPGYNGQCRVTPGEGETCQSILEYLNTAGTVHKTYCGGTMTRGGWTLVDCAKADDDDDSDSDSTTRP